MDTIFWIGIVSLCVILLLLLVAQRRPAHYARLQNRLDRSLASGQSTSLLAERVAPSFHGHLAVMQGAIRPESFARIAAEAEALASAERSYLPSHKKGGTIAYETLIGSAPELVRLYHSSELRDFVSRIVGVGVQPTPLYDQSSLSVLIYDRPGDHIGWHYDHNFYLGRHFTVLLPVVNNGHGPGGLSHAQLIARVEGEEKALSTPPNTLVVFEGARLLHRVTPVAANERRVVVSMTYCTNPKSDPVRGAARRIKDMAFFGVRALWT